MNGHWRGDGFIKPEQAARLERVCTGPLLSAADIAPALPIPEGCPATPGAVFSAPRQQQMFGR